MTIYDEFGYEMKASPLPMSNVWYPLAVNIGEPFPGAWQRNIEQKLEDTLAYSTTYSCITLIASDIAKLRLKLVERGANGIWSEITNRYPVLKKPNQYQTRIKFFENWISSKLIHGNTYALKQRGGRNAVERLYILDPCRVKPMVSDNGDVFYELKRDNLAGVTAENVKVPASEIIHDTMVTLYHPLCGVSPIYAAGLAAIQGLRIQRNSVNFFGNGSRPGGMLTAPGPIKNETASRLKDYWETNFTGENVGKVAVLGDGLRYEPMAMSAEDAQLIEQLRWTAENICSVFHVPPHMVGVGPAPAYNNIQALNTQYYAQCLQILIESLELVLGEGMELPDSLGLQFDLDELLQMDTATRVVAARDAIGAGFLSPNEARAKFSLGPVEGGATPYLQQQNFSLAALERRDNKDEETGGEVQATAFNGAQVTALQGLLEAAAASGMPPDTVAAAIRAAFPLLNEQQIAEMIDPLRNFTPPKPEQPQGPPIGEGDANAEEESADDQEPGGEQQNSFDPSIIRTKVCAAVRRHASPSLH